MTDSNPQTNAATRVTTQLNALVVLSNEIRQAETQPQLNYLVANKSFNLLRYQQCVCWSYDEVSETLEIEAISAVSQIDKNAPFVKWIKSVIQYLIGEVKVPVSDINNVQGQAVPQALTQQLNAQDVPPKLAQLWSEFVPENALWAMAQPRNQRYTGLWMSKEQPWNAAEISLTNHLVDCYSHARELLLAKAKPRRRWRLTWRKLLLVLLCGALFLPIRESTIAKSEVIPLSPKPVTAPIRGVIKSLHVEPNQRVAVGDLLVDFDTLDIDNNIAIANTTLTISQAELQNATQRAFTQDNGDVALLRSKVSKAQAELVHLQQTRDLMQIYAQQDGVVVFNDVSDWQGKPVVVGEKIMTLADPAQVQLLAWIPTREAVTLDDGAEMNLFLDINPGEPYQARLKRSSFAAVETPEGYMAFRSVAEFADQQRLPRLGLTGSSKIYGQRVTLFYYLLRRPMTAVRQFFGV